MQAELRLFRGSCGGLDTRGWIVSPGNPDQRTGDVVNRQALDGLLFGEAAAEDLLSQPLLAARCRHEKGLTEYNINKLNGSNAVEATRCDPS